MTTPSDFDYDIALSFAGEQRGYVSDVGAMLEEAGVRVFFDEDQKPLLWGTDLVESLDDVYRRKAFRVMMFVSESYGRKAWPTHERRSAFARHLEQPAEPYVLPVRMDGSDIPGLRPTTHYLDGRKLAPHQVVEVTIESLSAMGWTPSSGLPAQSRREQAQRVSLVALVVEAEGGYTASYTVVNGSDYPINTVVVVVADPGQPQDPVSQWGTAIEIVIGTIPPGVQESGTTDVRMTVAPPFSALTQLTWALFTDTWGQNWATNGSELRRKPRPARIC